MRRHTAVLMMLALLSGCGEEKPKVITPVDGIKQNIDIGEGLKKDVKDAAKVNSATEDQLNKKK